MGSIQEGSGKRVLISERGKPLGGGAEGVLNTRRWVPTEKVDSWLTQTRNYKISNFF